MTTKYYGCRKKKSSEYHRNSFTSKALTEGREEEKSENTDDEDSLSKKKDKNKNDKNNKNNI